MADKLNTSQLDIPLLHWSAAAAPHGHISQRVVPHRQHSEQVREFKTQQLSNSSAAYVVNLHHAACNSEPGRRCTNSPTCTKAWNIYRLNFYVTASPGSPGGCRSGGPNSDLSPARFREDTRAMQLTDTVCMHYGTTGICPMIV
jgi:hypothetical protein